MRLRKLIALLMLVICAAVGVYIATQDNGKPEYFSVLDQFQQKLEELRAKELGGKMVEDVLGQIPQYRKLIARNFGKANRYQIHVVSVVHGTLASPGIAEQFARMGAISAGLTRDYLAKTDPDVTASEMDFSPKVSRKSRRADELEMFRLLQLPTDQLQDNSDDPALKDGVLMYLDQWPYAEVVGGEDKILVAFVTGLDCLAVLGQEQAIEIRRYIYDEATAVRSHVALAKLIEALRQKSGKTGVVVMGGAHKPDFEVLQPVLGTKFTFYDAIPEE